MRRLFVIALLLWATAARAGETRPYTVDDSIELASFAGAPIDAPDHRHFVIVTERGVVPTNRTESTIWLFDRAAVEQFAHRPASAPPRPRALATMSATSNLPVIADVAWLDSHRLAFLGKDSTPFQQLFTADIDDGRITAVTTNDRYASSYEMSGGTIAYTTLIEPPPSDRSERLLSVRGTSLRRLLDPDPPAIADIDFDSVSQFALALHMIRGGAELTPPLRLFPPAWEVAPPLSIAPDGATLITLAPVSRVPAAWAAYEPWEHPEQLRLRPGDAAQTDEHNDLKPQQYVAIDLRSGAVTPLVDAPHARSLEYFAPTKIFWLSNRSVIVTNTFLPNVFDRPYAAVVDLDTHAVRPIAPLRTPGRTEKGYYEVGDIAWDAAKRELTIRYTARPGSEPPPPGIFALRGGRWTKSAPAAPRPRARAEVEIVVDEAFDRPPRLICRSGKTSVTLFDPNPQLASIAIGEVRVQRIGDWKALLALPPDFDPQRRYPLVIQTHGIRLDKFFTDGVFTTGNPGRALAARGFVVLQMPNLPAKFLTPDDGAYNLAAFQAAVESLDRLGIIDRTRVGVIGFSYTCYHTLYALTKDPSLFAAAAITDGNQMSYTQYLYDETNGFYQKYSDATIGGPPWMHFANWMASSPDFNLANVRAPLLISALEPGALLRHWEPYAALRRLGKPVDLLWLRGEHAPHVLVQPRHRRLSQQSAIDWFEFWLAGREDPDPAKREQYERWRALRRSE